MKAKWNNKAEAFRWVKEFVKQIPRPALLRLDGPMGAGKTQFVRWLAEAAGSSETASPTFAIHHRYSTAAGPIDHFDLYRVESMADLETTGFWEALEDPKAWICVEWSERLSEEVWPQDRWHAILRLHPLNGEAREVEWEIKPPPTKAAPKP